MKQLAITEIRAISGGQTQASITVTQKIAVDGISNECINALVALKLKEDMGLMESIATFIYLTSHCSTSELDLIDERLNTAPFLSAH